MRPAVQAAALAVQDALGALDDTAGLLRHQVTEHLRAGLVDDLDPGWALSIGRQAALSTAIVQRSTTALAEQLAEGRGRLPVETVVELERQSLEADAAAVATRRTRAEAAIDLIRMSLRRLERRIAAHEDVTEQLAALNEFAETLATELGRPSLDELVARHGRPT